MWQTDALLADNAVWIATRQQCNKCILGTGDIYLIGQKMSRLRRRDICMHPVNFSNSRKFLPASSDIKSGDT
jgi:hypothetical protein